MKIEYPQIDWQKIAKENNEGLKRWLEHYFKIDFITKVIFQSSNNNLAYYHSNGFGTAFIPTLNSKALQCMCWLDQQKVYVNVTRSAKGKGFEYWIEDENEVCLEDENDIYPDRNLAIAAGIEAAFKLLKS